MERIYFLPEWYLESKINKKRRIIKCCMSVLIIVNLVFIDMLILKLNKVKLLDNNINEKLTLQKNAYSNKKNENYAGNKTLDTFLVLIKSMPMNMNFKNISIENREVNIEVNSESVDCINFVTELEKKNQFILKSLTTPNKQESINFKANLELR